MEVAKVAAKNPKGTQMSKVIIIAAVDKNWVIGNKGRMPWEDQNGRSMLKSDIHHFKQSTLGQVVVMGRITAQSLKSPLPGRINYVISATAEYTSNMLLAEFKEVRHDLNSAIQEIKQQPSLEGKNIFIIGGSQIYRKALDLGIVDEIWLTTVGGEWKGDVFFPHDIFKNDRDTGILTTERGVKYIVEKTVQVLSEGKDQPSQILRKIIRIPQQ